MTPVMTYARSERLRKELQRANEDRAPANLDVLRRLTTTRHDLAVLLGYPTWAHYNLEERMVGTPEALGRFIDEVDEVAQSSARAELAELLAEKRVDHPGATSVGSWERLYYTNRVKAKRFRFDAQEVRPYLEYRRVREAILDLNATLFGMKFAHVVHEERWHPSVESFDVTIDGRPSGRISLDMHPREGKNKWFFNAPLVLGVGGVQKPHSVLCCNFPDPAAVAGPALMEHQQVVTYFHEFGHLVHGLARGDVPYVRLSRTEGDFMEAPSTFLEEWIYDHAVLSTFATHVATATGSSRQVAQSRPPSWCATSSVGHTTCARSKRGSRHGARPRRPGDARRVPLHGRAGRAEFRRRPLLQSRAAALRGSRGALRGGRVVLLRLRPDPRDTTAAGSRAGRRGPIRHSGVLRRVRARVLGTGRRPRRPGIARLRARAAHDVSACVCARARAAAPPQLGRRGHRSG